MIGQEFDPGTFQAIFDDAAACITQDWQGHREGSKYGHISVYLALVQLFIYQECDFVWRRWTLVGISEDADHNFPTLKLAQRLCRLRQAAPVVNAVCMLLESPDQLWSELNSKCHHQEIPTVLTRHWLPPLFFEGR